MWSVPFLLFLVSAILLWSSLRRHLGQLRDHRPSPRDPSTRAHTMALKSLAFFLLFCTLYSLPLVIIMYIPALWKHWRRACEVVSYAGICLHSSILVRSSPTLRKTLKKRLCRALDKGQFVSSNGLIIAALGSEWLLRRTLSPCDKLLVSLGASRFCLQWVVISKNIYIFLNPAAFPYHPVFQLLAVQWDFLNSATLCFSTWLTVFYCGLRMEETGGQGPRPGVVTGGRAKTQPAFTALFTLLFVLLCILGLLANGFIVLVLSREWLGTLRFCLQWVGMGNNFYCFLHLVDYCSGPARQFFGLPWDFLNSVTSWLAPGSASSSA
ncbi:hypothetical protein Celaphus_00012368 [Cervus elaphus hippelaphus]|uniref:Taste receptor type 2 n=1 Tax=Cervus elaphus hippelaphus TaxID=46360 RepID=A0A212CKW3_CEREH|nr:hypothetical protein Celaphus_00012368 [Cervus elaphus hippelaphus]